MAKMMTVSAGTAPGALVPLVLASFLNEGGMSMVSGWMKVKKRTLELSACQSNSSGVHDSLSLSKPSSSSSASRTYRPRT